jgi:hypothetical protein
MVGQNQCQRGGHLQEEIQQTQEIQEYQEIREDRVKNGVVKHRTAYLETSYEES